jgi:hypothetical protein
MNFAISWVLGLFKKPQVEVTFNPKVAAWPFPVPKEKRKPNLKKATTRKPAVKKPVAKKATKVVKKAK